MCCLLLTTCTATILNETTTRITSWLLTWSPYPCLCLPPKVCSQQSIPCDPSKLQARSCPFSAPNLPKALFHSEWEPRNLTMFYMAQLCLAPSLLWRSSLSILSHPTQLQPRRPSSVPKHARHVPSACSAPLLGLSIFHSLPFFKSLFKYHLLNEAYCHHLINQKKCTLQMYPARTSNCP